MSALSQHERTMIEHSCAAFFGGLAQQTPLALLSINRLLNAHAFDTIVELGTHTGGLSLPLALYCHMSHRPARAADPAEPSLGVNGSHLRQPKTFYTFDNVVRDESVVETLDLLGARFERRDTLYDDTNIAYIRGLITNGGRVLLLCDGGSKKRELDLYGSVLKSGDFVMLHDWARDEGAHQFNKAAGIWHGWETRWENGPDRERDQFGIKDLCARDGIEPIHADEFDKVAWFCGRKA